MTYVLHIPEDPPEVKAQIEAVRAAGQIPVTTINADGTVTVEGFTPPPELQARLAEAREEWKRLAEAGTPYWCVHEGRSVSHPSAYWKDDTPDDPVHRKHGVMCSDCGGYIQEG